MAKTKKVKLNDYDVDFELAGHVRIYGAEDAIHAVEITRDIKLVDLLKFVQNTHYGKNYVTKATSTEKKKSKNKG